MTSDFADLAMLARATVDAVHGEAAMLKPTDRAKGPHGARTASATRAEVSITVAFFQDTEMVARRRAMPPVGQGGERMLNRSPEIFGSTAHPGDVAVGDRLLRTATGDVFEVITIDPDGIGNRILGLAHIKG